jgi:hypothetical protein
LQASDLPGDAKTSARSRKVLVLSPFASHPADAGHRRRVLQTTRMFRDAGYDVTFLFYAFEMPWYWRFDSKAFKEMQDEWGEVLLFPASRKVGQPPENGKTHGLDEWWDPAFEQYLQRLLGMRAYDAMVVHNVWLSKAFDFAPMCTIKILETHDIFWKRGELYERLKQPVDFFTPTQEGEVYGLNRSDVIVTVTDEELELIRPLVSKPAFTLPTYEPQGRLRAGGVTQYLHPKKVVFGMLGSAHVFNILGMQRLLNALERKIGKTYAPVDIVIGGEVGNAVNSKLPIKKLGYVQDEADFYDQVDFVIAPLFEGTGFKVKVADAVIFEKPLLAATHAAEGTYLSRLCCSDTPEEMADLLVRVALERPSLAKYKQFSLDASQRMAEKADEGHALMRGCVDVGQSSVLIDLSNLQLDEDLGVIASYVSYLRPLTMHARVYLAPPPEIAGLFVNNTMAGTTIVSAAELADLEQQGIKGLKICPKRDPHYSANWIFDDRWFVADTFGLEARTLSLQELMPVAMVHPDVLWMPFTHALNRRLSKTLSKQAPPREIVFMEGYGQSKIHDSLSGILIVDTLDNKAFSNAIAWMLTKSHGSLDIVWSAGLEDPKREFVFELSMLKRFKYWGGAQGTNIYVNPDACEIESTLSYTFDLTTRPLLKSLTNG